MVDDEPTVREVVAAYLEQDGYRVEEAGTGEEARRILSGPPPDLVVLDVMLPGASGLELLRELRTRSDVPVILLTARAEEADRVLGLELGADDYVVKPFSPREVAARVGSVLRRSARGPVTTEVLDFGELVVDVAGRRVTLHDAEIELTAREFDLLAFLAAHPGQVFSRNQLLEQVWESSADWQDPATVTVHVRRIRTKLGEGSERRIATVWGVGYRFER